MNSKWLGILAVIFTLHVSADVIFQKDPYLGANFALRSTPGGQQMADYFVPSVSANISSVKWFGSFIPGGSGQPHDYSIRFFKDLNGAPSSSALFQATVTSPAEVVATPSGAFAIYSMQAVLPTPMTLSANERVWISILDTTPTPSSEFSWQESRSASPPLQWASRLTDAGSWLTSSDSGALAFTLQGTIVPEPNAFSLALIGLFGLSLLKRKPRS